MLFIETASPAGSRKLMGTSAAFCAAVRRSSDTSTEHPKQKTNLEFERRPWGTQLHGEAAATRDDRFRLAGSNASAATAGLRVTMYPRLIESATPRRLGIFRGAPARFMARLQVGIPISNTMCDLNPPPRQDASH